MDLFQLVNDLKLDTQGSLLAFGPELALCVTMVLMLLARVLFDRRADAYYIALVGSAVGLWLAIDFARHHPGERFELFTGMLVYDGLTAFLRTILLGFAVVFLLFTRLSGIPDREDGADIYTLVLGGTLGMALMASANHLLMIFMAVEMASVPSYVLAGMLKGRRLSSEAALKYSVYGAGAAGIMLYGVSLLAGLLGEVHLPSLAAELALRYPAMHAGELLVLSLASLMVMVGLAFKLSAVPFHFWCPDVFEGAAAEVGAFLSVASKAAALALLVRVAVGIGYVPPEAKAVDTLLTENVTAESPREAVLFAVADESLRPRSEPAPTAASEARAAAALEPVRDFIGKLVALLAIITCTFGNLAAYAQTNLKRLFAYSTIAHAGYMMMAVPPIMALVGVDEDGARFAVTALAVYVAVYLFMNLGAFAIIAFFRNAMGSEELADYGGLLRQAPGLVLCFVVILFSLVGLPPLAGFLGKFWVFGALANGWWVTFQQGDAANYLLVTLVAGGINTVISLFYYLRVAKVMTMDPEPEHRPPLTISSLSLQSMYIYALTLPIAALFVLGGWLYDWTHGAADSLWR